MTSLDDTLRALVAAEVSRQLAERVPAPTPPEDRERYVTDVEVAKRLGVSRECLQAMRRRGDGPPYFRVARRAVRYKVDDVERWLSERSRNHG